jgi:hypothetical protein
MLLALLLLACSGGAPGDCDQAAPPERDACLQAAAAGLLESGQPAQAEARIRQMTPGESRDLAWMAYARSTTLPVCGEIQDSALQEHCRSLVGRMHMRETPNTTSDAAPSAAGRMGCPPEGLARERCLGERAQLAETAAEALGFCAALGAGDRDGACRVDVAENAGKRGRLELGVEVCGGIAAPRWQSECWFRFSESAESAAVERRVSWCERSDHYADQCRVHLLDQEARHLASTAPGQPVQDVLQAAGERWTTLAEAGLAEGQGGDREALFWTQLSHQLLRLSVRPGRPAAAHLAWSELLPAARRRDLRDLVLRAWVRSEAAALPVESGPLLDGLVERFDAGTAVALPDPLPARPAADDRGRHQDTLGRLPWPLAPAARCTLSDAERDRIALLWAASSLDHPFAFAMLRAGAADEAVLVRAYALSAIEDRVFEWDRGGELGWGDLAEVLGERAVAEDNPLVRSRAAALVDALVTRQPLQPLQGFGLCDPVKGDPAGGR